MAAKSNIEWTDHTFNPWWGCDKVSDACKHCYADTFSRRVGHGMSKPALWGPGSTRQLASDKTWAEPAKWDAAAKAAGTRARVFCASMADVFEDRPELQPERERLFDLVEQTPSLDWLLLTKRPEHVASMAARWSVNWPLNVWLGTTAENQAMADLRIPLLLSVPARLHFVSVEPLLGAVDLSAYTSRLDWVILGGESGAKSRPMDLAWARQVRDQTLAASIPLFFKQWGNHAPNAAGNLVWIKTKNMNVLDGATHRDFPLSPASRQGRRDAIARLALQAIDDGVFNDANDVARAVAETLVAKVHSF
ncbi:MAG: phage Gp37/Gp68 family protein [Labilithrix sp.]|nr:phage Gp37/Gp68 family protein [Labilithrix sp.]